MKAKKDIDIEAEDLSETLRAMFLKNNIKGKTEIDDVLFDQKMQELIQSFDKSKQNLENIKNVKGADLLQRQNSISAQSGSEITEETKQTEYNPDEEDIQIDRKMKTQSNQN